MNMVSQEWRKDKNPLESARKYIISQEDHHLELLELEEEAGMQTIAFVVKDFMDYGHWTQSFLTDSTCKCSIISMYLY
jgi:hypothetical protein